MGLFDFLKFRPKHIFNENGENIIYFDNKKDGINVNFTRKVVLFTVHSLLITDKA